MAHLLLSGWMDGWIPRERGCPLATGVDIGEAKNRLKEVKRRKKRLTESMSCKLVMRLVSYVVGKLIPKNF